ncbi:hypothetical protein ABLB37_22900 [Vibrio parahaemolyticus]|uniref:Uncharacterized protein n=2 Tax=Vibrio parahaemolyticus TaxID=670 RepID=A0A227JFQ3_VIBPH|nr:hypothetical protein [Vibrio parahaemolyticus]ARC19837.1 hypothetical protein A6J30_15840 [Vibrio parahaemolyticus]AZV70717.1 hypothetical protein D0853_07110 [Vibrio parahaemolyticus]EGQ8307516.1 hypothetical protein [Vibrio parahaemolyticus]EGQ8459160.1 hypothetical protein [Vibrio parahaemolyticus]EGQ8464468.1 hypothetical protein [Vibrio parahaemolyticus]
MKDFTLQKISFAIITSVVGSYVFKKIEQVDSTSFIDNVVNAKVTVPVLGIVFTIILFAAVLYIGVLRTKLSRTVSSTRTDARYDHAKYVGQVIYENGPKRSKELTDALIEKFDVDVQEATRIVSDMAHTKVLIKCLTGGFELCKNYTKRIDVHFKP